MDISAAPPPLVPPHRPQVCLVPWIAAAATGSLMLVAAVLAVRRLAGAMQRPLQGLPLVAAALLFVFGAALLALFVSRQPRGRVDGCGAVLPWTIWLGVALLAAAMSVPGTPAAALGVIWLAVLFAAVALAALPRRSPRIAVPAAAASAPDALPAVVEASELPAGIEQQLSRSLDPETGVVIQGRLRAVLSPAQRSTSLHVGFCPPLDRIPAVSVEAIQGPPCTARVGLVLLQGARIDVRLDQPAATDVDVVLAFHAQERPAEPTAE